MDRVTLGIPHPGAEGYTKPRGLLVVAPTGLQEKIFEIFNTDFYFLFFIDFRGRFFILLRNK